MSINLEQFAVSNKATVESLLAVANTALATAERIAALNLNAARTALEDSASGAKAVLGAKDAKEAVAVQSGLVQPAMQQAVSYTQSLYEISTDSQKVLAKMYEDQFSGFQKQVAAMVEQVTKSAPPGSENIMATFQNAINTANTSFANMNAMAKQFAETAQANVVAAAKAATSATKMK